LISKSHRWQKTAIAAAAIALLGFTSTGAQALSLGRLTVLSALGEPLRAEIDVPEINAEEAASLRATVAAPSTFVAAGLDYNPAMSNLQTSLQRRPDGRAYIRLSSDRTVNDPYVDMILEATWSSGRIVRDYTLLFDPPALRQANTPAVTPTPAQITVAPGQSTASAPASVSSAIDAQRSAPASVQKPTRTPPATSARPAAVSPGPGTGGQQVIVKNGDTASKIAAQGVTTGVSLDQMLVAMMRSNPDAFVNNNLNRLRSGAVINMPTADQAQAVAPKEASQMVIAQSKDFNDFRRNLASSAPKADVAPADRVASGSVGAKVEDKKSAVATPDKLTLSKASAQAKADEARIAKERTEKEAAARAAEVAKNISDLNKLSAASAPKTAPVAPVVPAASEPVAKPASAPTVPIAAAPAASAPVAAASAPAVTASAPQLAASAVAKPKPAVAVAPVPVEPPGLLDELMEDPMVPVGAAALIAALGGFAFYRMRQRKQSANRVDSSFLESRLQPDSFFGASGGQRVDTTDGPANPSSMVYSTSQLDAADDVDPVAEADVYLAYGRDLQAEEILREAVRHNPGRLAIHTKLLEIFAKRRDTSGFQSAAQQALNLTGVDSPEWARICEMGLGIDPDNSLYQPGGASPSAFAPPPAPEPASVFGSTVPQSTNAALSATRSGVDLDLDLDFSIDDEPGSAISDVTGTQVPHHEQTVKMEARDPNVLDFDISGPAELDASPGMIEYNSGHAPLMEPTASYEPTGTMPIETAQPEPVAADKSGMLEFDMGSLSLDLESPVASSTADAADSSMSLAGGDPLDTKLALAEEFISIGDEDGARALLEEVVAEASGDVRAKAQAVLATLS